MKPRLEFCCNFNTRYYRLLHRHCGLASDKTSVQCKQTVPPFVLGLDSYRPINNLTAVLIPEGAVSVVGVES